MAFREPITNAFEQAHPSIANSEAKTYDRLEFLGDAILDFCVYLNVCIEVG